MDKKRYWENRSKKHKSNIRGVLFDKPYPSFVNTLFHMWSVGKVVQSIHEQSAEQILDVGCGYGRLGVEIVNRYPNIKYDGIDISKHYIKLFNEGIHTRGKGYVADMTNLPMQDHVYDTVFVIATLMYLYDKNDQIKALSEMLRVLKKDGRLVLIERTPYMEFLDIRKKLKRKVTTKQISFTYSQIAELLVDHGVIISVNNWPFKLLPFFKCYVVRAT